MSEDWLKLLYDNNYNMLYRLASNRLAAAIGHSSDVHDVLQEVFLLALRKRIYNHPNPDGWLVIATVNICNNYIQANTRKVRKFNKCVLEQSSGNTNSKKQHISLNTDETQHVDLQIALEQILSDDERDLLIQYYCGGLSFDEISHAMDISPNALRVRMHRIRKKLKKYLN